MNILYVHGFGSAFDPDTDKVEAFRKLGNVHGVDFDYCNGFDAAMNVVTAAASEVEADLLVGTSLGGNIAGHIASKLGVRFVALNPSIVPERTLKRHIGKFTDYTGRKCELTAEVVAGFPAFTRDGTGIVFVEKGDEVLDAMATYDTLKSTFPVHVFEGGSHGFENMEEALPLIREFLRDGNNRPRAG